MADPVQVRIKLATDRLNQITASGDLSSLKSVVEELIEMAGKCDDRAKLPVWVVWNRTGAGLGFDELSSEGYPTEG